MGLPVGEKSLGTFPSPIPNPNCKEMEMLFGDVDPYLDFSYVAPAMDRLFRCRRSSSVRPSVVQAKLVAWLSVVQRSSSVGLLGGAGEARQ